MVEINNYNEEDVDLKSLIELAESFLLYYNIDNNLVSIAFISAKEMQNLNKEYRGKDKNTDILSFPGMNDKDLLNNDKSLGELVLNYKKISEQASIFSVSVKKELDFIVVHGLLHLIGYTDNNEENRKEMINLGNKFLNYYYENQK